MTLSAKYVVSTGDCIAPIMPACVTVMIVTTPFWPR
jgi:hypothetical protein